MKQISLLIQLVLFGVSVAFAGVYDDLIKKVGDKNTFPGSNVFLIFDSTHVVMMETGLSHNYIHRLYKVLTLVGAKSFYHANGTQTVIDTSSVLDYLPEEYTNSSLYNKPTPKG
jgi:hypothetical protein